MTTRFLVVREETSFAMDGKRLVTLPEMGSNGPTDVTPERLPQFLQSAWAQASGDGGAR
jgi:hypothetical protein